MSAYLVDGKGWRYDFILYGIRQTGAWFETKQEAIEAEVERRKELKYPIQVQETPIDMAFLELVNLRLDHVQNYNSAGHYKDVLYHFRRWAKIWKHCKCNQITTQMVERHLKARLKVSPHVANKELQYLRSLFNFGIKKKLIKADPTEGIDFFPVERRKKYVPLKEDVIKVISAGDPEAQQYLWTIVLTAARMGEVNALTWDDVNFKRKLVTLWTCKRKGGNREPREVPMVKKLHDILRYRFENKNSDLPWVFYHTYWHRTENRWVQRPYGERKKLMATLCNKAKVKYFRYHALRHLTASILDDLGVPIGVIQRILGHRNRRTTEIYLHSIGEAEREAMHKLEHLELFKSDPEPDAAIPTNMHMAYWNRKVERPSYETLSDDIAKLGYRGAGRKYGVSDNAVRKWLKAYENGQDQPAGKSEKNEARNLPEKKSPTQSPTQKKKGVNRDWLTP